MQSANTFKSTVTHETFKIYNKLNRKSKHLVYLMECMLYNKQYTGNSETSLRPELESTIGNQGEAFLNNWYNKLKKDSLGFMKDIIKLRQNNHRYES